jgi:hypothetical protein
MCGGASPNFDEQPLQYGKTVSVGPPTDSTTLFYPVAVPSAEVGSVLNMNIEDDRPEADKKDQCLVIRGVGRKAVLWYCQSNLKFDSSDFRGGKQVKIPGGYRAFMLPCETTRLAWNRGDISYSVFGDPANYTPDEVKKIGIEIAREDADPSVPKVGRVVATTAEAETALPG